MPLFQLFIVEVIETLDDIRWVLNVNFLNNPNPVNSMLLAAEKD